MKDRQNYPSANQGSDRRQAKRGIDQGCLLAAASDGACLGDSLRQTRAGAHLSDGNSRQSSGHQEIELVRMLAQRLINQRDGDGLERQTAHLAQRRTNDCQAEQGAAPRAMVGHPFAGVFMVTRSVTSRCSSIGSCFSNTDAPFSPASRKNSRSPAKRLSASTTDERSPGSIVTPNSCFLVR